MLAVLTAFVLAGLYALMCLGWGEALRRVVRLAPGCTATDMALGIAALTVVGGVLNLARIAVPAALGVVAAVGAGLAALRIRREIGRADLKTVRSWLGSYGLAAAVILIATMFVAATVVPPSAMNVNDDLQKYLAHIARMLQTGTLYGSPLNALGVESPGGQPFLQAFVVAAAPFPYVNAFDALFCFGLCMAIAASLAGRTRGLGLLSASAAAGLALIEPQYVNISAFYSGSALMLALYALIAAPEEIAVSQPLKRAWLIGVVAAAMVALKPTFLMMAAIMFAAGASSLAISTASVRQVFAWSMRIACGFALGLLPWVLLYAPYLGDISAIAAGGSIQVQADDVPIGFLSAQPLTWGASGLAYTTAVGSALFAGALGLSGRRHLATHERAGAIAVAVSALGVAVVYVFVVLVLGRYFADDDTALRYVIPVMVAAVPACIALGGRFFVQGLADARRFAATVVYSAIVGAALMVFAPSLGARIAEARDYGHMLAFRYSALTDTYRSLYARLTSSEQAARVYRMQESVPPGAPILVVMSTSYLFDFRRNPIYDVTFAGIHAPWAHIPPVEYVIWEYTGDSAPVPNLVPREPGQGSPRLFGLVKLLVDATNSWQPGDLIYNDGTVAVFRVSRLPKTWNNFP